MSESPRPIDRLYEIIQRDGLSGLTEAEAGYFAIYWFVAETNNGGLHAFFFNDSGQLAFAALRYLEAIGARDTASVLRRAIALFPRGKVPEDLRERREVVLDVMEPNAVSFTPLTKELFACTEDVDDLHRAYARQNQALFSRIWDGSTT